MSTIVKTPSDIAYIRHAARILADVLKEVENRIQPGIKTNELDSFCNDMILSKGCVPAFKGYRGYPACVCINDQVIHGLPGTSIIQDGDIVSVDIGVNYSGYYADAARTFSVGNISREKARLITAARKCLELSIKKTVPGNRVGDISWAIQDSARSFGVLTVNEYSGHGVGINLHEKPHIPNFGKPGTGEVLKKGMILAIEPMVTSGNGKVVTAEDGWTVVTQDGSPSAHFEDTVLITDDEPIVLTEF